MVMYNYVNDVILKLGRIMGNEGVRGEVDTLQNDSKD